MMMKTTKRPSEMPFKARGNQRGRLMPKFVWFCLNIWWRKSILHFYVVCFASWQLRISKMISVFWARKMIPKMSGFQKMSCTIWNGKNKHWTHDISDTHLSCCWTGYLIAKRFEKQQSFKNRKKLKRDQSRNSWKFFNFRHFEFLLLAKMSLHTD